MKSLIRTIIIVGAIAAALALVWYVFQNYKEIEISQNNSAHKDEISIEVERK